jgi:hypothetical protein
MTPTQLSKLLDELQELGFPDDVFKRVHHFRDAPRQETIRGMQRYCATGPATFETGGNNERLGIRLEFILKTYRAWALQPGDVKVFMALAEAAYLGIPPVTP